MPTPTKTRSNKVYEFTGIPGNSPTTVSIQSSHGLINGDVIEILRSSKYQGTFSISNITQTTFDIDIAFDDNETGCVWQISRARPVLVNPEGETVDTLRQALNQIGGDVGNKFDLDETIIADRRNLVAAINSLQAWIEAEQLKSLIRAIATN